MEPAPANPTTRLHYTFDRGHEYKGAKVAGIGAQREAAFDSCPQSLPKQTNYPGLVDWVSGRRPHSPLPQSRRSGKAIDKPKQAYPKQTPASVGQRTDTLSTSLTNPAGTHKPRRPKMAEVGER
jgi:hypothetical protein